MAFVITEPCLGTCDTVCVSVCPVDCIHGPITVDEIKSIQESGETQQLEKIQLFIDPDICIDCGVCEADCPVTAIFEEDDVPEQWQQYTQMNADFFNE